MARPRVLVVDDEATSRDLLTRILSDAGYDVVDTFSAEEALALLHRESFDLVTLDVMMPFVDGLECCRRIRQFSKVPVVFVTARSDPHNEVEGFQAGGDDYIRKPYHIAAVVSRVQAVLRRAEDRGSVDAVGNAVRVGPLQLDIAAQEAYLFGRAAGLTTKEFELLRMLAERCGQVVPHDEIANEVWGEELDPESKTLRVHVYRLRKKLDSLGDFGRFLLTKRDRGYLLSPELRQVEAS
ncbi:MAG: response regulator transcription factor [Phycisphaerales bacterium]|nr:response regulator transcription factor [Phycisphaerales bacterium]